MLLRFINVLFLIICLSGGAYCVCNYLIGGLHSIMEINSETEVGEVIMELTLIYTGDRRRRRGYEHYDMTLDTNTTDFTLSFLVPTWKLQVTKCLPAGHNETLTFSMHGLYATDCTSANSTIIVMPTKALLSRPTLVEVNIGTCGSSVPVEITPLQFNNTSSCASFECQVNCTNDGKTFWMDTDKVFTLTDGVDYGKTYNLHVVCNDENDVEGSGNKTAETNIDVDFTTNCTAGGKDTETAFFDKPANVAVVSSVAGVATVGAGVGVGALAYKSCKVKQISG